MRNGALTYLAALVLCSAAHGITYSSSTTPVDIPDNDPTGIASTISVPDSVTVTDVNVAVSVTHPLIDELTVTLTSPVGTVVVLHDGVNVFTQSVISLYDDDCGTPPDGPGTLADFNGAAAHGTWTLRVIDNVQFNTGALDHWELTLNTAPTGQGISGAFTPIAASETNRKVTLYNPFTVPMAQVAVVSAEPAGHYCVELPAGIYWIEASTISQDCGGLLYAESRLATVTAGLQTTENFSFSSTKTCGGGSIIPPSVVGTVLNSVTGLPVPSAKVSLDGATASATTAGVYFFTLPSLGGHTVRATAAGYVDGLAEAADGGSSAPQILDLFLDPVPAPPAVTSITRVNPNPTNAASVQFTVTFSAAVSGVGLNDLTLTTTGVAGAALSSVSGAGTTRTIVASTGSGSGTVRLDVVDNDSIVAVSDSTPLGGAGAGNGDFNSGEVYTIDRTAPDVTLSSSAANPTSASPIPISVSFSEAVTSFTSSDVTVSNGDIVNFGGSGASYTFNLTPTAPGAVTASIPADAAQDAVGNGNNASATLSRTYTSGQAGDVNHDSTVDAVDVQLVINKALGIDIGGANADIDNSGAVDAVDVQLVINAALGV